MYWIIQDLTNTLHVYTLDPLHCVDCVAILKPKPNGNADTLTAFRRFPDTKIMRIFDGD